MTERETPPREPRDRPAAPEVGSGASGAARLRRATDEGRTADKVDFPDPAAAPLGTDDEAAGTPPTEAQVRMAEDNEVGRAEAEAPEPGVPRHQRGSQVLLWLAAAVVLLIVAAWLL